MSVIFLAALGGLVVAVVVKYADNVLKGFAASSSIVLSCLVSNLVFRDSQLNIAFVLGAVMVIGSAYVYSYKPPETPTVPSAGESCKKKHTHTQSHPFYKMVKSGLHLFSMACDGSSWCH